MARTVQTCTEGDLKYEFGEYSSGTFADTFAIPTSLRTCIFATGYYEGSDLWTGGTACVSSTTNRAVTKFSICSAEQYYLDFSIPDASTGITPNCLAYFAVGT